MVGQGADRWSLAPTRKAPSAPDEGADGAFARPRRGLAGCPSGRGIGVEVPCRAGRAGGRLG